MDAIDSILSEHEKPMDDIDSILAEHEAKAMPEEPSFGEKMKTGLLNGLIPYKNTIDTIRNPKKNKFDVAGAIGGDTSGLAVDAIGYLTGGGIGGAVKSRGAQALLGAASPILEPLARKGGEIGAGIGKELGKPEYAMMMGAINPLLAIPSMIPEDTTNEAAGFVKQLPELAGRTAGELAPSAALVALGGKAYQEATAPRTTPLIPEISARAEFSKTQGIPLTEGETLGKTSPQAIKEAGYRRVPGGEESALGMEAKQQTAIREALAKQAETLGDDVLAGEIRKGGGMTEGRQLADIPQTAKNIRSERGAAVGEAKKALAQEIPIRSNFGKELTGEFDKVLKSVEGAGKGSARSKVASLLQDYKAQAKTVKTMKGAIDFMDDFDSAIKSTFDREAPNVQKTYLADIRKKISNVLDEAGKNLAPEQQANLKAAKSGFSEIADESLALKKMEDLNPSALAGRISRGSKSLSEVKDFQKVFKEGTSERMGLKSAVFQDLIKKATKAGGISGEAMAKAIKGYDGETLNTIFNDSPKDLKALQDFSKGLSDVEAQRTPLGTTPKGGSHTSPLIRIASRLNPKTAIPAWLMEKYMSYKAGKAFKPYELPGPKGAALPWLKNVVPQRLPAALGAGVAAGRQ